MSTQEGVIKRPYIRKVVIHGFKTYGSHTDIEEFSPGMNVVVGLNGAGKSNFLAAICFVLGSDRYFKMGADDRKALLHRGPGDTVIAGYVELHMENMGDNINALGLPSDVVVRRTVGMKKDEYLLNNKRAELNDVINMFETIGFSRSNPYNIVLQGQVEALAAMSSAERLELVKDIAGARLYDEKKAESLKILKETEVKMAKVGEVIQSLQERMDALDEEKEELSRYQQLDKKRRALEHRVRDLDLTEVERYLAELEAEHATLTDNSRSKFDEVKELENALEQAQEQLREIAQTRERAESQKMDAALEHADMVKLVGALELEITDSKSNTDDKSHRLPIIEAELKRMSDEIKKKQVALEKANKAYEAAVKQEMTHKTQFEEMDRRAKELYSKQGRIGRFKTKKERDAYLKQEIEKMSMSIAHRRKQTSTLGSDIAALETVVEQLEAQISGRGRKHEELMTAVKTHTASYQAAKTKRDDKAELRKVQWKEQKDAEERIFQSKSELLQHQKTLYSTLSRDLVAGLEAVAKYQPPPGHEVYGPLIDLILVDEIYTTAVEVTAGNSLFHIVVDTDETAALLLTHLNNTRSGRVTCIPLNKIQARDRASEIDFTGVEAEALSTRVKPKRSVFQPAINQLFGKTVVCLSLELATQLSSQHRLACVTIDGNQVNMKGALTGGYIDDRASRFKTSRKIRELGKSIADDEVHVVTLRQNSDGLEEVITRAIKEMADVERKKNEALYTLETFADTTRTAHRELLSAKEQLAKRHHSNSENETAIKSIQATIAALEEEMSSELFSKLSEEESEELQKLSVELDKVSQDLTAAIETRAGHEATKAQLEALLGDNLLPLKADLESQKTSIEMRPFASKDAQPMESLEADLSRARERLTQARAAEAEFDQLLSDEKERYSEQEGNIAKLEAMREKAQQAVAGGSKQLEKLFNSRATAIAKRDDLLKRIREIGSLPSKDNEEVSGYSYSKCQRELADTKEALSGFGGVNKKALDQYLSFSEEKEKFSQRSDQMKREYEAIFDLIGKLDLQKDDAIGRTFRGVAKNFTKVFAEAVPDGEATLVMRVNKGDESSSSQHPDQYVGIDLKVTFNKNSGGVMEGGATKRMSGGQKTITSLSLIFAIQRCDPAPFYIFDEIDPALDDRYRATVAEMIRNQSEAMQFIIVTHHPEMVQVAHKNYVVSFRNRVSRLEVEDVDTALEVVAAAQKEEQDQTAKLQQGPKRKRRTVEAEDAAPARAEGTSTRGAQQKADDDDDDDDELIVRFDRRERDEEPLPPVADDDVLEPAKRRPKRGRESGVE